MAVNQYTSESGPEPALPPEQKNSYIDHQTLLPVSTLPNKLEEETGSKQFHREPVIQDDSSTRLVKKLFVCECVCVCVCHMHFMGVASSQLHTHRSHGDPGGDR